MNLWKKSKISLVFLNCFLNILGLHAKYKFFLNVFDFKVKKNQMSWNSKSDFSQNYQEQWLG